MIDTTVISVAKQQLSTPIDLGEDATDDIAGSLKALLADVFALYHKYGPTAALRLGGAGVVC